MRYGSVCSGVEAASLAWEPLGWRAQFFAEVDAFPSAVLAQRWPDVPNLGDFTTIEATDATIDLLVGGTPCQAFSSQGLRGGLGDKRGGLALEYFRLAQRMRPRWVVWENVAGVLSVDGGRAFGSILGALGECGYGFAWRVLDAQYFGVPQRRRRVFVVGYLGGDSRRAGSVLFEHARTEGYTHPVRAPPPRASGRSGEAFEKGLSILDGDNHRVSSNVVPTLSTKVCHNRQLVMSKSGIRHLTPTEWERLQGMPDGHTLVTYRGKPARNTPRYKAIGNSMAVPVMRWIGERIAMVDSL